MKTISSRLSRRRQKTHTRPLAAIMRGSTGAIDLASIMVGVLVIGIIGGVIAATVFAVIPWTQENAAKQTLGAFNTAQGVSKVQTNAYGTGAQLIDGKLLQTVDPLKAGSKPTTSGGWVAAAKSADGHVYLTDDTSPKPVDLTGQALTQTYPLSPPVLKTVTASTTGGTLAAGTYYYVLDAVGSGETTRSNEIAVTTTGTTSSVTVTFTQQGNTGDNLYRSLTPGAETVVQNQSAWSSGTYTGSGHLYDNTWVDAGEATNTSTPPTTSTATYTWFSSITDVASALATE